MAEMLVQSESLVSIADIIREKGGTSDALVFPDGFVTAISAIQTGGGGGGSSTRDFYFGTITNANVAKDMIIPYSDIPDVLVIVGPLSGSADRVGLAIHIKDADGGIYQEKRRYQSKEYLIGTSATDGSLFTLSKFSNESFSISINSGESSYGSYFSAVDFKVFAAKLF